MQRLLCLVLFGFALPASAQIGVYGMFSASNFKVSNTGWEYGSTFGVYDNRWSVPFFSLGLDGRGAVVGSDSTSIASGLVGPRFVFKPHIVPLMPYVEALGGVGHAETGVGATQIVATKFEYSFVGGIDYTFFPRLDWRIVDFSYGGLSSFATSFNPRTISTGIVFRLP